MSAPKRKPYAPEPVYPSIEEQAKYFAAPKKSESAIWWETLTAKRRAEGIPEGGGEPAPKPWDDPNFVDANPTYQKMIDEHNPRRSS